MWLLDLLSPVLPDPSVPARHYGVLPKPESPRYLVPLDDPKSTAMLVRPGGARSVRRRLLRLALRPALRLRLLPLLRRGVSVPDGQPGSPSLVQWLEQALDEPALTMSVAIGPPRPNRKPILQVLTPEGRTVCYGKIAVDDHTARLVRNESAFLAEHRPTELVVPELLTLGLWKGREIALLSPLALDAQDRGPRNLELTVEVVMAIARLQPLETSAVLDNAWWHRVRSSAGERAAHRAGRLQACIDDLARRLKGVSWTFGAWHGDLTPWNAEWVDATLHVWDWERTGGPVPVGFDPVHSEFQVAHLRSGLRAAAAAERTVAVQGSLLQALGVPPAEHRLLVDCYLLELCLRLVDAAHYGPIGGLGPLADDILAALLAPRDR